jgi:hypothetical protein
MFVEVGACGIRLVCLLLQLRGFNRLVGNSFRMQEQVNRYVEEAIMAYRQDATFTGSLCLVAIEPVGNYILLEQPAEARDYSPDVFHVQYELSRAISAQWPLKAGCSKGGPDGGRDTPPDATASEGYTEHSGHRPRVPLRSKAERVIPKTQATIEFISTCVRQQGK